MNGPRHPAGPAPARVDESGHHFDPQFVEIFVQVEREFAEIARFLSDDKAFSPPRAAAAS